MLYRVNQIGNDVYILDTDDYTVEKITLSQFFRLQERLSQNDFCHRPSYTPRYWIFGDVLVVEDFSSHNLLTWLNYKYIGSFNIEGYGVILIDRHKEYNILEVILVKNLTYELYSFMFNLDNKSFDMNNCIYDKRYQSLKYESNVFKLNFEDTAKQEKDVDAKYNGNIILSTEIGEKRNIGLAVCSNSVELKFSVKYPIQAFKPITQLTATNNYYMIYYPKLMNILKGILQVDFTKLSDNTVTNKYIILYRLSKKIEQSNFESLMKQARMKINKTFNIDTAGIDLGILDNSIPFGYIWIYGIQVDDSLSFDDNDNVKYLRKFIDEPIGNITNYKVVLKENSIIFRVNTDKDINIGLQSQIVNEYVIKNVSLAKQVRYGYYEKETIFEIDIWSLYRQLFGINV